MHYYCGTGAYSPGTYTQYPTPQAGMTCYTMYFCVDPSSTYGVVEVTEPVATEACYDTIQEAYAAIGMDYHCSISLAPGAPTDVTYYIVCPGGLVGSVGYCPPPSPLPPNTKVGVVYTEPCPASGQSSGQKQARRVPPLTRRDLAYLHSVGTTVQTIHSSRITKARAVEVAAALGRVQAVLRASRYLVHCSCRPLDGHAYWIVAYTVRSAGSNNAAFLFVDAANGRVVGNRVVKAKQARSGSQSAW